MRGYVYILTNSAMPGLVKIGWTNIDPHDRAKQLHTTGVPVPFKVYGYIQVDTPKEIEKATHARLSKFRLSKSREYFKINPEKAVEILESVSGAYELKRQQEAAEAARRTADAERRRREQEDRKRQEQFDQELFSFLEMACKEAEKKVAIRFYKNLAEFSWCIASFILLVGLLSFKFVKIDVLMFIGFAWALFGLIYLTSSKITKYKFIHLEKIVCSTMEKLYGQIWHSTSKSAARRCSLFGTQEVKTILSHTGGPVLSMTMESSGGANGVPLSFS